MGGELVLDNVPIVTPNCDLVVPSLSLTVTWRIGYYDYDVGMIIFLSHDPHANDAISMCSLADMTQSTALYASNAPTCFTAKRSAV